MVMDVICRRLCVILFVYSELDMATTSEAVKYLFIYANVWWRCAQYVVIASCD